MQKLMCLVLMVIAGSVLNAQVDGPYSGNSFSVVPIPGSSNTWVNQGNSGNSDNAYATFGNLPTTVGSYTDYLVITDFMFAIPPGAIITGIVVDIERSDPNRRTSDYSIRILKNGVISATDRASGTGYRATDNYQSYGSAGDLWGETWTDADINDPGFGIAIAAKRNFALGATNGRIDDVQITVFYNFVLTPVNLLSFAAIKNDKDVNLKWTTAEEVHMDHYEIERSVDGTNFASIGNVHSQFSASQTNYSFLDNNPVPGTSYYRLKLVGTAGDIRFSKVIAVTFTGDDRIGLYPNPLMTGQNLRINNSTNEPLTIAFYTVGGQQIATMLVTGNTIPGENLSRYKGILFYKIFFKNKELAGTGKLLVQ